MFKNGLDLQLRIMERLGEITAAAHSENLHIPLAADGREMFLRFQSKGDFMRSYMGSHAPMWGHNVEAVLRYIRIRRDVMDPSKKSKFNGGGNQGSHRRHW